MRALVAWLMRSRLNATLGAAVLGLVRPLDLLSGALVALTTLVQGPREGLRLVVVAGVLVTALAVAAGQPPALVVLALAVAWVPVLLMAAVVRQGGLALGLHAGLALVIGVLLAFHATVADPVAEWRRFLGTWVVPTLRDLWGAEAVPGPEQLESLARMAGGVVAALALLSVSAALLLGRWWQALMQQPGGFGAEFRAWRNGRALTALASLVFVATLFSDSLALGNLALVLLVPFLLQGFGLVHRVVARRRLGTGWLVATYGLALLFPHPVWAVVAGMGFADNWWDFDAAGAERPGP